MTSLSRANSTACSSVICAPAARARDRASSPSAARAAASPLSRARSSSGWSEALTRSSAKAAPVPDYSSIVRGVSVGGAPRPRLRPAPRCSRFRTGRQTPRCPAVAARFLCARLPGLSGDAPPRDSTVRKVIVRSCGRSVPTTRDDHLGGWCCRAEVRLRKVRRNEQCPSLFRRQRSNEFAPPLREERRPSPGLDVKSAGGPRVDGRLGTDRAEPRSGEPHSSSDARAPRRHAPH